MFRPYLPIYTHTTKTKSTPTTQVDALAQLALNRPVRVRVDSSFEVAPRLEQEVITCVLLYI